MNSDRWKQIEIIFDEAIKKTPQEREAFIKELCGDDIDLLHEVKSLLDADSNVHSIFDDNLSGSLKLPVSMDYEGEIIGSYKILNQIASGGMGTVFLAERNDGQFEQKVALKLIKPGSNSLEIIKRFQSERQILARLQHPNIASLLDGGITDNGIPYFTMEYVEGKPVDKYCDEDNLSIDERLNLFTKICSAVHYAHQNLIIHRDLKPNNILVTNEGKVKLLDFGIAKMFSEDNSLELTQMTRTGLFVMTPEYASPEQIRGESITTATDIYSLGIILYRLLTGFSPYEIKSFTPLELEKVICLTIPDKPSTAITRSLKSKENKYIQNEIFNQRKIEPDKLHKKLSGDLDNICLMALRKEPDRRYSSAEQFKADIEKYIKGLPVIAHPPTIKYRSLKFLKRNKYSVISAFVILFFISFLTTFYFIQLKEERDKARLEAEKSLKVSEFLQNIFRVSEPSQSRGESITARELLERGAEKIISELKDQPEIKATMLDVIGTVYMRLGLYKDSEELLQQALNMRQQLYGENNFETSKSINNLGELLSLTGNYEKSKPLLEKAVIIQKELLDENSIERIQAINNLAILYNFLGEYFISDSLYRVILSIFEYNGINKNETLFTVMNNLALGLHESGSYEEADSIFRKAYSLQKEYYGDKPHPEIATTSFNFGQLLRDKGNYNEAEKMLKEALEMDKFLNGSEHPDVAYSLQGLASIYKQRGLYTEAQNLYYESLSIRKKLLGNEHPDVAYSLFNLGLLHLESDKLNDAENCFKEALVIQKKFYGNDHPAVANSYSKLAEIDLQYRRYNQAEELLNKSNEVNLKVYGKNHLRYASNLLSLAKIYSVNNKHNSADSLCREAINISNEVIGRDRPPFLAGTLNIYGQILLNKKDYQKADSVLKISLNMHKNIYGKNHIRTAKSYIYLGELMLQTDSLKKAVFYTKTSMNIYNNIHTDYTGTLAEAESIMGEILTKQKNYTEAEKYLRKSYTFFNDEFGKSYSKTIKASERLNKLYKKWDGINPIHKTLSSN